LYEMATGVRAFQRKTPIDTLSAILNDEPEPIASRAPQTPPPLRWIVDRCLVKAPEGRYMSTRDLARELVSLRDHASEAALGATAGEASRSAPTRRRFAVIPASAALVAAGFAASRLMTPSASIPDFRQVTFRRGVTDFARFAPDGQTIV